MFHKLLLLLLWARLTHGFIYEPLYQTEVALKRGMKLYDSPIAVDAKNYMELVTKSSMFVDNTLFIVSAITWAFPKSKRIMMVGPRKWGKSMTLDMLRTFLDVHVTPDGENIPRKMTDAYTLFHKGEIKMKDGSVERLQKPLLISTEEDIMEMFQGRIPVIYFSFKDLIGYDHETLRNAAVEMIQGIFYKYRYMPMLLRLSHGRAFEESRKEWLNYLIEEYTTLLRNETKDYFFHTCTLEYLTQSICLYHGRKPYILIDDFDGPILNLLRSGNATEKHIKIAREFLEGFVANVVAQNEQLSAAIISANFVPKKPKDWIGCWSYELVDITLKNTLASEYLGFNRGDVETLMEQNNIPISIASRVHQWYGNYISNLTGYHYYNPYSISSFLKTRKFLIYVNSSQDRVIINRTLENCLESALNLISQRKELVKDTPFIGDDSAVLMKGQWPDYFYNYCFRMGYLSFHSLFGNRLLRSINSIMGCVGAYVTVPNHEMSFQIANWMFPLYKRKYNIDDQLLRNVAVEMLRFVDSETTNTSALDISLQALYKHCARTIPMYTKIQSKPFFIFKYQDNVHPIFNCITLRMQCLSGFHIQAFYNKIKEADIVLQNDQVHRATVIEVQFNATSPQDVLDRALRCDRAVNKLDNFNELKFVGINISPDCTVSSLAKFEKKIVVQEEFNQYEENFINT